MAQCDCQKISMKLFALVILGFLLIAPRSFAQQSNTSESSSPTVVASDDYQFPYPGILPDNPLYLFKVVRDRLVDLFISDPLRKSQFYLLESEKRFNAGLYLLKAQNGKEQLTYSTISKGNNYLEQSIQKAEEAKKAGTDILDQAKNINRSIAKQREVLMSLIQKGSKSLKESLTVSDNRLKLLEKRAKSLLLNQ